MENERKSICFCADVNYINYIVPVIESIANAEPHEDYEYHIITDIELSGELICEFSKVVDVGNCLVWHYIDPTDFDDLKEVTHITKAMYYRLLIPKLINRKKVLYLDCDVLVRKPIVDLFCINLAGHLVGAVINPYFKRVGIVHPNMYFNSGVMLVNCEQWINEDLSLKVIDLVRSKPHLLDMPDQDALNIIIAGRWFRLNWKYNSQMSVYLNARRGRYFPIEAKDPCIVHFSANNKQWHKSCGLKFVKEYYSLKTAIVGYKRGRLLDFLVRCRTYTKATLFGDRTSFFLF